MAKDKKLLYCSFCGKSQDEVARLIAGPSVFICDECVGLCNDIIETPYESDGKTLATCKLCGITAESDRMLDIQGRGFLCQECMSVVYEDIRQWYLKE